ncbi:hypothetical protein [Ignatzschineria cameli]|uniref:hypothetical protein n=1 Tax=Ignatzschineria cameli TaxID=2182793 RepID=UPI0013009F5F|nr:hypothetical protein [Ignatzschineria cameli]
MPARTLWKHAEVFSGNSSTSFVSTNKKAYGRAGADYFILFTGACPPAGIYDAGMRFS